MTEELTVTPPGAKLIEDFVNTNELDEPDGEKLRDPAALSDWLGELGYDVRSIRREKGTLLATARR